MAQSLTFVLSGGVINQDPDLSLGGPPSPTIIDDSVNNLFADVTGTQTNLGFIDYRCYYIFNDNDDDYVNFSVWIDTQGTEGSFCEVGITNQNEKQDITFVNVSGGDFTLSVDGNETDTIAFTFDPTLMAAGIQTALRDLSNASEVVVASSGANAYRVEWAGVDANTAYPLLAFGANGLLPDDPLEEAEATFTRFQSGSPVNLIAPDTGVVTTAPTGVVFSEPDVNSPIVVGTVRAGSGFPVWIRRSTDPETEANANDGVTIKYAGDRVPGGV